MTTTPAQSTVIDLLDAYVPGDARQSEARAMFRDFVAVESRCCERSLASGHLTGSAWLVSADGRRVLLTHHRKLDRWLQPGGHADGDPDLAAVALREANEETGVPDLVLEPGVYDLDRHRIPERRNEPAHWHWDVRFVVRATGAETFVVSDESHALAWREIADVAVDPHADESVRRMAAKWLRRGAPGEAARSAR